MQPAGHQEIARALGRRLDQHRRFDLEEAALVEEVAHRLDDLVAQDDVALERPAAQIQVAVLHAQVFVNVVVFVDLKRRNRRTVEYLEILDGHLDLAGRQFRVLGAGRTAPDGPAHADDVFVAQALGFAEAGLLRIEDDLCDAVAVAQVGKDQAAVVAPDVHPAR